MWLPTLEDLPEVSGRRVLVRCDFNVPLLDRHIRDDGRIRAAIPTLRWLQDRGAHVTACSHLGRPHGRPDPAFDIAPVRDRLNVLLPGIELLENLRFDPGEEANDPAFVDRLISGQDYYVNDAFGAAHRAHGSIVGPPARLPAAAGRLLAKEVEVISRLFESPSRPFVAVLGGAKVTDKLGLVSSLLERADTIAIGGAMCFTFLAAKGIPIGDSPVDHEQIERCRRLLASDRILLPTDLIVGNGNDPGQVRQASSVPSAWKGLDLGPESVGAFGAAIRAARTVLWNGPMGVFEDSRFAAGTNGVALAVAECSGLTVVGGGDTVAAVTEFGVADRIDHVSTGGGAMLELVERGDLPGLRALRESVGTTTP